jgi:non-heme chloroperoxidase
VPINATAYKPSELVEDAPLKVYEGAPHGLIPPHKAWLNEDLLAFLSE